MSERRAIIDIGSNTVRLVIYGGPPRAPAVLLNEKVTPKLGRDVARDGLLSDKSMEVALTALKRFALLLRLMSVTNVEAVATAAVREARNGKDFLRKVSEFGLFPRMLSGEEEARSSAMGVIAAFPGARGVAGDLGGGSLELTRIDRDECGKGITLPFGTLRLPDLRADGSAAFTAMVKAGLQEAGWTEGRSEPFFIVGGSWRALALYAMDETGWALDDPHDFELPAEDALRICKALAGGKIVRQAPRISTSRMASLPDAAALLGALMSEIRPSRIVFSSWGLREGLLYGQLDKATRAQHPMLAGVTAFAANYNVSPEKAAKVAEWTAPVCPTSKEDEVLRLGASKLALAAMGIEPNMRAEHAMGWALRKRWIGLNARGRALIAMAVLANSGNTEVPPEFARLAGEEELHMAICWGLSIRLCRRLTGCTDDALAGTAIRLVDGTLVLTLDEAMADLCGNPTAKDLRYLAEWLGVDWTVEQRTKETVLR